MQTVQNLKMKYNELNNPHYSMGFAGYVAACVQLYCLTVLHLVVTVLLLQLQLQQDAKI
jgi:hypothetical protein